MSPWFLHLWCMRADGKHMIIYHVHACVNAYEEYMTYRTRTCKGICLLLPSNQSFYRLIG